MNMQSIVSCTSPAAPWVRVRRPLGASWSGRAPARLRMSRAWGGGAPTTAPLRARCGGRAQPVAEARNDVGVVGVEEEEAELLVPEQLEMLEDEAMGGGDEGRRPTDYDRRAHIFEASSRVFLTLKQRADSHDAVEAGAAAAATAAVAETACDRHEHHGRLVE